MPYTLESNNLPAHVQELSKEKQRQWIAVFNAVLSDTGSEAQAFAAANEAVKDKPNKSCEVKDLGNNRIGGYGIVFSDADSPDLEGEYFTSETDFWDELPTALVLFDHTLTPVPEDGGVVSEEPRRYQIGKVIKRVKDEYGIWFEALLDENEQWKEYVLRMIEEGRINYSTDSIEHLAARVAQENGTSWISSWPIPFISVTHHAAEPRAAVRFMKGHMVDVAEVEAAYRQFNAEYAIKALHSRIAQSHLHVPDGGRGTWQGQQPTKKNKEPNPMGMIITDPVVKKTMAEALLKQTWPKLNVYNFSAVYKAMTDDEEEEMKAEEDSQDEGVKQGGELADQLRPLADQLVAIFGGTTEEALAALMQLGIAMQQAQLPETGVEEPPMPSEPALSAAEGGYVTEEMRSMGINRKAFRDAARAGGYHIKNAAKGKNRVPGFRDFIKAIVRKDYTALKALGVDPDDAGGYLVPTEQSDQIIDLLLAKSIFMNGGEAERLVTYIPMDTMKLEMPAINTGVTAYWTAENTSITESEPTFRRITLVAKKLALLVPISNELMRNSSPAVDNILRDLIAREIANEVDRTVLTGTGTDAQPLGISNVADVTRTALAAAPTYASLVGAVSRLEQANVDLDDSVAWVFNYRDKNTLREIKDSANQYIFNGTGLFGNQLAGGVPELLLGYDYVNTNNVKLGAGSLLSGHTNSATQSNMYFGRWRDVYIGLNQSLEIRASDEAGTSFQYDQTWIRAIVSLDVVLAHPESIQVLTRVQAS